MKILHLLAFFFLFSLGQALAVPPDLTAGEEPQGSTRTSNLGPTGLRGWIYHEGKSDTTHLSRQIQVSEIDSGSPADGLLQIDDVILGATGDGSAPTLFSSDARKTLALAIQTAEANNPGFLKLLVWRSGTTSTIDLTLPTLGAYSATAPYNCPKSALILQQGLNYLSSSESAGQYSFGTIALLASGDPTFSSRIANEVTSIIPSATTLAQLSSDAHDTASNTTWERGHKLILLSEYYLATNDASALPAIEAYALNIAKNQSFLGTVGHKYADRSADGSNGPMGGVYGVVNSAGLPCFLGLLLAQECGITDPSLQPAIDRTARFFSYYAHKGAIPYGEHEPARDRHESNGKSGLAAIAFSLLPNRNDEARFFAQMATAASGEREIGHTGSFFNYLWSPLGAAAGGEEAAAEHFSRMSWHLDLARNWDGSFDYDCLNGEGPNSGSQYNNFRMSTAALLLYALPERKLHITGKHLTPAQALTATEVANATTADHYDPSSRTTQELISDLSFWSPKVQSAAATELADNHNITSSLLSQIEALAVDPNGSSRAGACQALGLIGDASSGPILASLLTDPDDLVRFAATDAMRYLPQSTRLAHLDTILAAAVSTAEPWFPFDETDPLQFAHGKLSLLLFHNKSWGGPRGVLTQAGLNGVDRNLLYPAIKACAGTPVGLCRAGLSKVYDQLTYQETLDLADVIVDSIMIRSPADKMFSQEIRVAGLELLERHQIAEGVPLAEITIEDDGRGSVRRDVLDILEDYAGSVTTVTPDPDTMGYLNQLLMEGRVEAQDVLDAISADSNPATLTPLKSIDTLTASPATLILPADSTTLLVTGTDAAQGNTFYTWQTLSSTEALFSPITTDESETLLTVPNAPDSYQVEVTMADSRGLTSITEIITIEANVPAIDIIPPTPAAFATPPSALSATSVTMTAQEAFDYSQPVEYLFWNETTNTQSGWSTSLTWAENNLITGTPYSYRVKARDNSPALNESDWSAPLTVTPAPDTAPPLNLGNPWSTPPTPLSNSSITMSAAPASDINGVEYYFANLSFPDGSHDSGWQSSLDFTDFNLQADTSYQYALTTRDLNSPPNTGLASLPLTATTHTAGILFADTFNRSDLNSTSGKSGLLAPLDYGSRTFDNVALDLNNNNLRINGPAASGSFGGLVYLDHNFSDPALASGGTFSISIDIAAYSSAGSGRQMTVGLGQSLADLQSQLGVSPSDHFSDLLVAYRDTTDTLEIYKNGVLDNSETIIGGLPNDPTTLRIDYTIPDFLSGSTVSYEVHFDNSPTAFTSGTFDWSDSRENYLSFSSNLSNDSRFDNLQITGTYAAPLIADYDTWSALYSSTDLTDPNADSDSDGLTNAEERLWGLDPSDSSSLTPHLNNLTTSGAFSYTRRSPALTGAEYSIWTSPDLLTWTEDPTAQQVVASFSPDGTETIAVILTTPPTTDQAFVIIGATAE